MQMVCKHANNLMCGVCALQEARMRKLADELAVSIHARRVAPLEGSVNQLTALAKSFAEQLRMAAERSRSENSALSAQPAGRTEGAS